MMNTEPSQKNEHVEQLLNMIFLFFVVLTFSGIVFLYTLRNIRHADLLYEISMLQKEKQKIQTEVDNLRLSVANYSTPDRIEKLYRDRLGYFPLRIENRIQTLRLPEIDEAKAGSSKESQVPGSNRER